MRRLHNCRRTVNNFAPGMLHSNWKKHLAVNIPLLKSRCAPWVSRSTVLQVPFVAATRLMVCKHCSQTSVYTDVLMSDQHPPCTVTASFIIVCFGHSKGVLSHGGWCLSHSISALFVDYTHQEVSPASGVGCRATASTTTRCCSTGNQAMFTKHRLVAFACLRGALRFLKAVHRLAAVRVSACSGITLLVECSEAWAL